MRIYTLQFYGIGMSEALVAIFDRYPLRSKKARDYAIWRQAVLALIQIPRGRRGKPSDYSEIYDLRLELVEGRKF